MSDLKDLRMHDRCPSCNSTDYAWADEEIQFPVGGDFDKVTGLPNITASLTVKVPVGTCGACEGKFLNWVSEYVTDAAAKVWRETQEKTKQEGQEGRLSFFVGDFDGQYAAVRTEEPRFCIIRPTKEQAKQAALDACSFYRQTGPAHAAKTAPMRDQ